MNTKTQTQAWNTHYQRSRARLSYPDENLVRIVSKLEPGPALDLGCGSGRHLRLLEDYGFGPLAGVDSSETSIHLCREQFTDIRLYSPDPSILSLNKYILPFPENYFKLVIIWGVLHYNSPQLQAAMLTEIQRILAPGGILAGTLRAAEDTHFKGNQDLTDVKLKYYDETTAREFLGAYFEDVQLGYIERAPIGQLERRVCHWTFTGSKHEG